MTGPGDDPLPGGDAGLCAEYVLGLLPEAEARAFEARLAREPALVAEVAYWSETFAGLTEELPEEAPAPALRRRIAAATFGPAPPPLWRQVLPYLLGAVAAAALAWAVSLSGLLSAPQPGPTLHAELTPQTGQTAFSALYDPASSTLTLTRTTGALPDTRAFELWLIPPGAAPLSLGVLPDTRQSLVLPDGLAAALPGATLAVSEEPPGGSATGAPSGPILAAGVITAS